MELKLIRQIIEDFEKNSLTEMELDFEDVHIKLKKSPSNGDSLVSPQSANYTNHEKETEGESKIVKSPLVGTVYTSKSPDKPPLVKVGQSVEKGQTIAIIEAMKVFNEIPSPHDGTITKVHFSDGDIIGYHDSLFTLE